MAYTKNTWVTGDIITADKLNNLETGVADSVDGVKLTGDQTVTGNKTFSGNISIGGTPMNYTRIPELALPGWVSGLLNVDKQSGIVSITSTNLVISNGAKAYLPSGYYPRKIIQAPLTGKNSDGTVAGGYITINVDGTITFDNIGFASGDIAVYVNVSYVAQV